MKESIEKLSINKIITRAAGEQRSAGMSHDHLLDLIFKDPMLVLQTLCPWLHNYTFVYMPVTTH